MSTLKDLYTGAPGTHLPSPDEIQEACTGPGGWTAAELAEWGVPWPPPKGWRRYLERRWQQQQRQGAEELFR